MSISHDIVTFAGNIGNDLIKNETRAGKPVVNFRVATSSGYFDQRTGAWVEGNTNWYAVAAFGRLAEHAAASLHRGDAVIVSGRLRVKEWEANGKKGVDVEIVADAIGHDLNSGTSAFARRPKTAASDQGRAASDGAGQKPDQSASLSADTPTDEDLDTWRAGGLEPPAADHSEAARQEDEHLAMT